MRRHVIACDFRFEAAHQLPHHDGKCARLHGHSYTMTVAMTSDTLHATGPQAGMLIDFAVLRACVQPLVDKYLDHRFLNETLGIYTTSENIARWAYEQIAAALPGRLGHLLESVTISETCQSRTVYQP